MLRRLVTAGFAAALLSGGLLVTATTANAAPCPASSPAYPSNTCGVSTSSSSGQPGSHVTVAGDGFSKNCAVIIKLDSTKIGTGTSDGTGHFTTDVTIPSDASTGAHTLTASDTCSAFVLSSVFTVTAPSSGSTLPFTGLVFWPLVGGGAGLVIFGVGLVIAGRRRRAPLSPAI
jgi:hypothetical protein